MTRTLSARKIIWEMNEPFRIYGIISRPEAPLWG
jgi:hypothetical protein